jgi:hypothetical protein
MAYIDLSNLFVPASSIKTNIDLSQEVVQSAEIMPNETEVTSSNPPPLLVRTCQKKKKKKTNIDL